MKLVNYLLRLLTTVALTERLVLFFLSVISLLHSATKDKTRSCLYFNISTASINGYSR